jgi:hypothetical protein
MNALPCIVPANLIEENLASDRVSCEELSRLAMELMEDLYHCEGKPDDRQAFAQVMNSAGALILAITEPGQFLLPGSSPKKAARSIPIPGAKRCIPLSLH